MLDFEQLSQIVEGKCAHPVVKDTKSTPHAVVIHEDDLLAVCQELHENAETFFDMLSCLTGIDNGVEAGTMEVVYHLYSIPFNHALALRVVLPRENPVVETLTTVWRTADWHEREAYDLLGIQFKDHQDLRRILLPADWEGHPLRKDYQHQEYYRNIKVEY